MKMPLLRATRYLLAIPVVTLLAAACGGTDFNAGPSTGVGGSGGTGTSAGGTIGAARGGASAGGTDGAGTSNGQAGRTNIGGASTGGGGVSSATAGSAGSSNSHAGSGNAHAGNGGNGGNAGSGNAHAGSAASAGMGDAGAGGAADEGYQGPSVRSAKPFAVLAYSAITSANISTVLGDIGVSAGAVSTITGFDAPSPLKYGLDSIAPNSMRTTLAQQDVTALVGDIDPRPCDADYTNVVGGLTGDITLYPGVTCMNSLSADVLLDGRLTLDARGNPNAFFIIRGKLTLTVADAAQVILANGAEACGVFWRISAQVTIGKTVQFYGTVVAGSAITMSTGSALIGRALAQTAGVHLDANVITAPSDGLVGSASVCTHVQ